MSFYKNEDPDPEIWDVPQGKHRSTVRLCRECRTPLIEPHWFNGWTWCLEHYREVVALSMTREVDDRELAGQEQAARQDIERDDFNYIRR